MSWPKSIGILITALILFSAALAQDATKASPQPVLDVTSMDKTIDPCVDFYSYSCGNWMKKNPIPPDQSNWGAYSKLQDENLLQLRGILESAANPSPDRSPVQQKIGDYYASCMDEKAVEEAGASPLKKPLEEIDKLGSKGDLAELAAHMVDEDVLFNFGSQQDFRDATQVIAGLDQGGLGLPDRDYYVKTDRKSADLRKAYVTHVTKMFELLGDKPAVAAQNARTVMRIETALAKGSLTRLERRDPKNLDHKMSTAQLSSLNPSFRWDRYFSGVGLPTLQSLNVQTPHFFQAMDAALKSESLANWKTYLRWHLVNANAIFLSTPFVNENFDFYGKTLQGKEQLRPRW
jgi:predicted metalloendopeptidase